MPGIELHVWSARLDSCVWPSSDALPPVERERAARILRPRQRRRWTAARWALRQVLGRYLGREPALIELRFGARGKPMLAERETSLRFNLSHSGQLALIAIGEEREVGVDVQLLGGRPLQFYVDWTRREAVAKCHGTGLWAPPPDAAVAVAELDTDPGYAAAVAIAAEELPTVRRFEVDPR